MSQPQNPPKIRFALPSRQTRIGRWGCRFAVVLWFMILLTPCFCLALASQGEISVRLGDIPGQSFRIWLLNESRQRGIGSSRPSIVANSEAGQVCLQTDVSFVLWAGSEDATTYCECFAQSSNAAWEMVNTAQGSCPPR